MDDSLETLSLELLKRGYTLYWEQERDPQEKACVVLIEETVQDKQYGIEYAMAQSVVEETELDRLLWSLEKTFQDIRKRTRKQVLQV